MPCIHKKTLEAAQQSDNHLLVQLKRNQPTLHDSGKRNRIESREASTWLLKPNKGEAHWADALRH